MDDFLAACRRSGKVVCVPALRKRTGRYGWALLEEEAPVQMGRWGILEPAKPRWVAAERLELIVIPGLAFDRVGGRLGHGGGHFDRLLAQGRGFKVGVAFERQILAAVPSEAHDVPMDAVVTETTFTRVRGPVRRAETKKKKDGGGLVPGAPSAGG